MLRHFLAHDVPSLNICAKCLFAVQYLPHGVFLMKEKLTIFQSTSTLFWYKLVKRITSEIRKRLSVKGDKIETIGSKKDKESGNGVAVSLIKHVFVLMLENRAIDHMLGFSKIIGIDATTGKPTSICGVDVSTMFNVNPSAPNIKVPPSEGADFKLSKPQDDDLGHEFLDTLVALCGLNATYDSGPYPHIDNSGFIAEYATMKIRNSNKIVVKDPNTTLLTLGGVEVKYK
jgi:hypothetical protein